MACVAEPLSCGEVEYFLAPNAIGPIFVDGQEIVRRIFVTVRDASWNEIELQSSRLEPDPANQASVLLAGYHDGADIRFSWVGRLRFDPEQQELSFDFAGQVLRDGVVCRLGLIVLLPPERVAGASGAIASGEHRLSVAFSAGLGPQPIVNGLPTGLTEPFQWIELTGTDGGTIELAFEGEMFEIEDQRNWGDASFKIYCTPLARGFPRPVRRGDQIEHKVRIQYKLEPDPRIGGEFDRLEARRFPAIGITSRAFCGPVRNLPWSYVSGRSVETDESGASDCNFELLLDCSELRDSARPFKVALKRRKRVRQILLFGDGAALPSAADLAALREMSGASELPIFAATRGWFVELNRGVQLPEGADGFAWPITPTVHSRDSATMFENFTPFTPMAAHLRAQGASRLAIANLSWGGAESTGEIPVTRRDVLTWLVAALIDAAMAGIECVTLGEDLVRHLAEDTGTVRELARLVALSEASVTPIATDIDGVAGLLFTDSDGVGALAVNCSRGAAIVTLPQGSILGVNGLAVELPPRSFAALTESEGLQSYAEEGCAA